MSDKNLERETHVTFNDEEPTAHLFTCHKRIWSKMEKYGINPDRYHEDKEGKIFAMSYEIPKSWVSIRRPRRRTLTAEQKQVLTDRLAKARVKVKKGV